MGLPSCIETPTEFSPLVRTVGDVRGMAFSFDGLKTLTPNEGIYAAHAVFTDRTVFLGEFNVNEQGQPIDTEGDVIERFGAAENLIETQQAIVTVRIPGIGEGIQGGRFLQGLFEDGVAELTIPLPDALLDASGVYRVFTPTDGPGTNETSGFWALDPTGEPGLSVPDLTGLFLYEHFMIIEGRPLSMGRFDSADEPDNLNRFSGELPAPEVPGEDFLTNAPDGLEFPVDLSGARFLVTIEPRAGDLIPPGQLVLLEAILPAGLVGGEHVQLVNVLPDFPTGTAAFY